MVIAWLENLNPRLRGRVKQNAKIALNCTAG